MEYFHQAEDWLLKLASEAQFFRKDSPPSLEVVDLILDALDRPDRSFQWRIVVGGTAGKGTVCRLTEDVLLRSGKTVATLISPHVQVVTERIRINGELINAETFGQTILKIKKVSEDLSISPTYYEAIVVAGILAGKDVGCEILIGEVGMGGRLDAVNSVKGKRCSALTFIGEDHLEKFDRNIKKLAEEKAGIFTEECAGGVSYEQKMCSTIDSTSKIKIDYIKGIKTKLNKKLARKICKKVLGHDKFIFQKIQLPCRWEIINLESSPQGLSSGSKTIFNLQSKKEEQRIILDGAHSGPRFEFVLPKLKKIKGPKIGVFAMAKNHDPKSFQIIEKEFDEIIWTEVLGDREFWNAAELQKMYKRGLVVSDPIQALKKASQFEFESGLVSKSPSKVQTQRCSIIVLGSFYLAGQLRGEFYDSQKMLEQGTEFPVS
jgi:folylpolyglutamate synthase/dihydrofolate synthase